MGIEARPKAQFQCYGAERYRSDLRAFVADQEGRYLELSTALVSSGAVKKEDAERSRLKLDISVTDRRSVQVDPIPMLGIGDHLN